MKSRWWQDVRRRFRISIAAKRSRRRPFAASPEPLEYRLLLVTRIWDGGVARNDQWTERRNWEGNIAPNSGDSLVFPDSIRFTDRGLNNDFPAGTDFNDITFQGEGYLIRGNRIDLTGDLIYAPRSDVNLSDSKLNLDIRFSDGDHEIRLVSGVVDLPELEFNGILSDSGDGNIEIKGDGQVIFGGSDPNSINLHAIVVENASGSDRIKLLLNKDDNEAAIDGPLVIGRNGSVVVADRGTFTTFRKVGQLSPGIDVTLRGGFGVSFLGVARETIGELTMDGGVIHILNREVHGEFDDNVGGLLTLADNVSVTGSSAFIGSDRGRGKLRLNPGSATPREFDVAAGARINISEDLTEGDLRKIGAGIFFSLPNAQNTHGETFVDDGTLILGSGFAEGNELDGRTIIPNDLFIRNGGRVLHDRNNNAISDTANIRLSNGGRFEIRNGFEETVSEITATGGSFVVVRGADSELVVTDNSQLADSQLTAELGGIAKFLDPISLARTVSTANKGTLQFSDVVMTAGLIVSLGADGRTNLLGKLTVNADAAPATINGQLLLRSGNHDFVVGDGATVNDLVINALIDDGAGVFGAPASITKKGPGRMLLTGANIYHGTTTITNGPFIVNGQQSLDQDDFIVTGGALAGKGRVREIIQNAGVLNPGNGIGIFNATESTFLGDLSRFVVQINGATVGTQFDQLKTAALSLGTAAHPRLDVQLGFSPNVGQQFRIVDVTGNTLLPVDQVFRDLQGNVLTEGASFLVNGLSFTITYNGGNGNDVVITRNTPPALQNIAITPEITEGQSVFVTGHITEPNPGDTFFLDVNWGDGSLPQTFRFAPGSPRDIRVGHRYLDDPDGAIDRYHVRLSWRDQFGGNNSAALTTIVRNASPKIQTVTASLPPLRVGVPITIQGVISDRSPNDSLRVFIQWVANGKWQAVNLPAGSTTFTFHHTYGQIGQHQVTVQVIDDDLDFDQLRIVLNVV